MTFNQNHRLLFGTVFVMFLSLTLAVAIIPALNNQANYAPLPDSEPLSADALAGKALYIANGCVACHTQQVRNVAMDKVWGSRPSIAADYAGSVRPDLWRNSATLMGTERTGPDLTSIGIRQPSSAWQLLHLYNPRTVVPESIMPAYPWLFEEKAQPDPDDTIVNVPDEFKRGQGQVVAKKEALQLVAYLFSLKQTPLPDGAPAPGFLYQREVAATVPPSAGAGGVVELDGAALYATHCQTCHQPNGEGLKGAFPSLKGSAIVVDDSPERMITIIMKGYNARAAEGYPPMPAVGTLSNLKAEEVRAIINHERSSWGNSGRTVPLAEVETIMKGLAP